MTAPTANTAKRVDVGRLTDALATAAELGRTVDRLARVGGGEWSDAYHAHRAECVALVRDHGPDISALLLQVAEGDQRYLILKGSHDAALARTAAAESKLAEQAAEIDRANQRAEYWKAEHLAANLATDAAERAREEAQAYKDAAFDGNSVFAALTKDATCRTGPENVSDVLDALARVAKAAFLAANGGSNA